MKFRVIELDSETAEALMKTAEAEVRTPHQQAIVAIRRGLGLEFPYPEKDSSKPTAKETVHAQS